MNDRKVRSRNNMSPALGQLSSAAGNYKPSRSGSGDGHNLNQTQSFLGLLADKEVSGFGRDLLNSRQVSGLGQLNASINLNGSILNQNSFFAGQRASGLGLEGNNLIKLQQKVLRATKDTARREEWSLYMQKSELATARSQYAPELEQFLLRVVIKLQQNVNALQSQANLLSVQAVPAQIEAEVKHQPIKNNQDTRYNALVLQNTILIKRLSLLQERLAQVDHESVLKGPNDAEQDDSYLRLMVEKNKFEAEAKTRAMREEMISSELQYCREYNTKLQTDITTLMEEINFVKKQIKQYQNATNYKEAWTMAYEQLLIWRTKLIEVTQENRKLTVKVKGLKEKNRQLLNSFDMTTVLVAETEEQKQQLDHIIRQFQQWLKVISLPQPQMDQSKIERVLEVENRKDTSQQHFSNYRLTRPNFFTFFQAFQSTIVLEKNILHTRNLQADFFLKMRASLDAMFAHFSLNSSFNSWQSFPDFVVGFTSHYKIDPKTRKLEVRSKPISNEERLTFLMNLFNRKAGNLWECEIYRRFILEQYTLDEVYFYLECRNEMINGQPSLKRLGAADPIRYVRIERALIVVTRMLAPFDQQVLGRVKSIVQQKSKKKDKHYVIDEHFVLRLLLEVYSLEKYKMQRVIQMNFRAKGKNPLITFSEFEVFMQHNFKYIGMCEVAQLFRQLYHLTSGKVTPKAIHYMCGARGLLIPLLIQKRQAQFELTKQTSTDQQLLALSDRINRTAALVTESGCADLTSLNEQFMDFMKSFEWFRSNKRTFHLKKLDLIVRVAKANAYLDWHASDDELLLSEQLHESIRQINRLLQDGLKASQTLLHHQDQRKIAIRKLTRSFRARIQQSLDEFKRFSDEQIKNLQVKVQNKLKADTKQQHQKDSNQNLHQ